MPSDVRTIEVNGVAWNPRWTSVSAWSLTLPVSDRTNRLAIVGYVDRQLHAEIDLQAVHVKRLTLFGVSKQVSIALPRCARNGLPPSSGRSPPKVCAAAR